MAVATAPSAPAGETARLATATAWVRAAFGVAFFFYAIRRPDLMGIPLGRGEASSLVVFPLPFLSAALYGIAALATLAAVQLALRPRPKPLERAAWPLAMLPAAFLALPLRSLIGPALPGLGLFLLPVAALSLFLLFLHEGLSRMEEPAGATRRWALAIFLVFTVFYAAVGTRLTRTAGAHSGDEGHYLVQAESLYADHDLDIRNNFSRPQGEAQRLYVHISPNSRGKAWYSWHPFGLSVLMAPATPGGVPGRHLVLALVSGAGLAGTFLLARAIGAGLASAALATILLGTSLLWGVYSSRALPEVAGAALTAWLTLAGFIQQRRPRLSLVVAAASAAALPWMHTRFLAAAPIGIAGYVLLALAPDWRDRGAWVRSALLVLLGAAGYGLFYAVQYRLFVGGNAYGFLVSSFFTFPKGLLYVLTSERGIPASLASFLWLFPAAFVVHVQGHTRARILSGMAFLQLAAVMLAACTNIGYDGGSCLPGRYLVVVTPLFVAIGAAVLDGCGRAARWWFMALSALTIMPLALLVNDMTAYGFLFGVPHASEIANPVFHRLPRPFPFPAGLLHHLAILGIYAATLWLLARRARRGTLLVAALVASLAISSAASLTAGAGNPGHERSMMLLDRVDLERAAVTPVGGDGGAMVRLLREPLERPREVSAFDEAWIRGVLLQRLGENEAAIAAYEQAAAIAPARSAPLIRMAACRRALGQHAAAGELERRLAIGFPAGRPIGALFDGSVRLRGFRWELRGSGDSREACLDLSWESVRPVARVYGVFVHYLKDGVTTFRADHQPPVPIPEWKKGELIDDPSCTPLPPGIDPEGITAVVGLWDEKSRRLPTDGGSDRIELRPGER